MSEWMAFGKVVSSEGESPGPGSQIRYVVRVNDPDAGGPVTYGPLRPWNPLEYDPDGNEVEVFAIPPQTPVLCFNIEGRLQFVAFGPAEPRAYTSCDDAGMRGSMLRVNADGSVSVGLPPGGSSTQTGGAAPVGEE